MDKEFKNVKKGDVIRGRGSPSHMPFVTALEDAVGDRGRGVFVCRTSSITWTALGHFRVECKSAVRVELAAEGRGEAEGGALAVEDDELAHD